MRSMRSLTWFVHVVVVCGVVGYFRAIAYSGSRLDPHFQKGVYRMDVVHVTNPGIVSITPEEELTILT